MTKLSSTEEIFLEILRAGLWESHGPVSGSKFQVSSGVDWNKVYQLAAEQSVLGLVLAGLEHSDIKPQKELLLQWIGEVQMIEQKNKKMNAFIADLIEKLRKYDIYAILVKGQGIAQCYKKPLWRSSGDVDLVLDNKNYENAKKKLIPIAYAVEPEEVWKKHLAFKINEVDVELHGKMPFGISKQADKVVDEVLDDSLKNGGVIKWSVDKTDVFMPNPDNHLLIIFTHFLRHFFLEGVGLRQICDWCRLIWTYKDSLNYGLLESRIRKMELMSEWKAFYNLASRYLGMPDLDSRFMFHDSKFDKKADGIMELVLESGNFGHNKDLSYRVRYKGFTYKIVSFWRRLWDFTVFMKFFPLDSPRFFITYMTSKVKG